MRLILAVLLASFLTGVPAQAELPEFYQSVDRLIWVVEDADATIEQLRRIGFTNTEDFGVIEFGDAEYKGKRATGSLRFVSGRFGDVAVHWIEPHGGSNAFTAFLARHKSGVFSLMHRVPTAEAFDAEIERMSALGVGVLMSGSLDTDSGEIRWAFFDTEKDGKYSLGIVHFPGGDEGPLAVPAANPSGRIISQYAFAVKQPGPVSAYWAKLGFPPMKYTQGPLHDKQYRGAPADFDMRLGWQRHGKIPYEWIQSLRGPDVYLDSMKIHGEGFHHVGIKTTDMDAEIEWWTQRGYPVALSGGWGEKGKPGSGRFAYVDTEPLGGVYVELLWSFPKP